MSSPDEVNTKIQELEALKKEAGWWKLGGTIAILIIVLVSVFRIIGGVTALAKKGPEQDKLVSTLKTGFNEQILPDLKTAGIQARDIATEALKAEMEKLNSRLPEFSNLAQNEAQALVEELRIEAETVLNDTFQKMLDERETKIRKMFPKVDQEKLSAAVADLNAALERELRKLIEELFMQHLVVVDSIIQQINKIAADDTTDLLDQNVPWEVGALVFEILRKEFDGELRLP